MMETVEEKYNAAVAAHDIPGAVIVGCDVKGDVYYAKAFGLHSLKEGDPKVPLNVDDSFWLASCTKFMTSIAALQCVERGQFTLDEDVTRLLPELKDIDILKGFDEQEKPILVKATKKITLRHLITHSSGLAYDVFDPTLQRYRKSRGEAVHLARGAIAHSHKVPLLFEPGEMWTYSGGLDWTGKMIERANGVSLEEYMQKYIWQPLSITSITFHPDEKPAQLATVPQMSARQAEINMFGTTANPDAKVAWDKDQVWELPQEEEKGGAGAYGSAVDYIKILRSITADDGKLLKSATIADMFTPQLSDGGRTFIEEMRKVKELNDCFGMSLPVQTKLEHGLGGMITTNDTVGRRRKGSMYWSGLPNNYWLIDRASGICAIYLSQLTPTADPHSLALWAEFEKALFSKTKPSKL